LRHERRKAYLAPQASLPCRNADQNIQKLLPAIFFMLPQALQKMQMVVAFELRGGGRHC
jgi:hypothetical protein